MKPPTKKERTKQMKKLMIAAAVICAAAMVQASTVTWSSTGISTTGLIYSPDGTTKKAYDWGQQTGYTISQAILMNADDLSQSDMLKGLRAGTYTFGDSKLDATSLNTNSKFAAKETGELTSLADTSVDLYYALLGTDNAGNKFVMISSLKEGVVIPYASGDTVAASWASDSPTFSAKNFGSANFSAAGWYAASDVPEPTSGLLLLLGVAGLALKRKRA